MVPQPTLEQLRRWDPERIGPYAMLGRLGAGAMGQVYLGRSTAGRLVAVKTIKIELAEEAGFRDHFAHEVAAARRVSGMFTAAVVAADPQADVPWLATAYIPAPSLSRLVRSCGPQPVATIRWLAAGCAEALESIHDAGLVHRDLKPSNVLVAPDGPRVIDFGVARAAERIQLTVTRGAVGTPAYMAPEQARDTRQASMASDVFALGATLLFAATGHAPYQGETVMDVLVRLATEPPDLTGLPAELADIITACLERSPRDRPTSAALLERLGPFVDAPADTDAGHSYLAEPAMALIAEFQRNPQFDPRLDPAEPRSDASLGSDPSQGADTSLGGAVSLDSDIGFGEASDPSLVSEPGQDGGATYASQLGLPVPASPPARRWPRRRHPRRDGDQLAAIVPAPRSPGGPGRPGTAGHSARRRRHDATLPLAGRAAAAIMLVGAGAALGVVLSNHDHAGSGIRAGISPSSGTGASPSTSAARNPRGGLGPLPGGSPGQPPSAFPTIPPGKPAISLLQPFGDQETVFVVHGAHWPPGSRVSVTLTGHGTSSATVFADRAGSFNYAIDQGHAFFPGRIPPGLYHVVVTGPGGQRATGKFQVAAPLPPGASPPPGGPPPTPPPGSSPA
jgi:serine/threonine protein kinase